LTALVPRGEKKEQQGVVLDEQEKIWVERLGSAKMGEGSGGRGKTQGGDAGQISSTFTWFGGGTWLSGDLERKYEADYSSAEGGERIKTNDKQKERRGWGSLEGG